ncbi:MAG: biotin transporter BioY [Acidimicrobiales bacterium]
MSTTAPLTRPGVLVDTISASTTANVALVVGAAAFVGALAQISIHLSFTPVPVTGQTLGVLLAGAALGWRRASLSMALYVVAGVAGVPWFAGHASGAAGATFGYLLGFVAAGAVTGALAARRHDRTVARAAASMIAGEAALYAIALPWLALSLHVGLARAISLGFVPFVIGDLIKALLAGLTLPAAWRVVQRSGADNN